VLATQNCCPASLPKLTALSIAVRYPLAFTTKSCRPRVRAAARLAGTQRVPLASSDYHAVGDVIDRREVEASVSIGVDGKAERPTFRRFDVEFPNEYARGGEFYDLARMSRIIFDGIAVGGEQSASRTKDKRQRTAQMRIRKSDRALVHWGRRRRPASVQHLVNSIVSSGRDKKIA